MQIIARLSLTLESHQLVGQSSFTQKIKSSIYYAKKNASTMYKQVHHTDSS